MPVPQNIYDNPDFFAAYERLRRTGTGLNEVLEQPALWSMLPCRLEGLRVLDLGCGFGDFARKVRQCGARSVVGIDVSEKMLKEAAAQTDDPEISFRCVSIEEFALAAGSFDLIVSSLALHYVQDYTAVVGRVANLLCDGGTFVFSVEHPICTALDQQQWVRDAEGNALHWPVDQYRREGERKTRWFVDGVIKHHRTVESYVNGLIQAGLTISSLKEPGPIDCAAAKTVPNLDLHRRRPPFLLLAAEKRRQTDSRRL